MKTTPDKAEEILDETRRFFQRTSHSTLDLRFRYEIVDLDEAANWAAGIPTPQYGADGTLVNPGAYPVATAYTGYECRFLMPDGSRQIIFKDADENLAWTNNSNIHRNYCQVAERNYGGDALRKLATTDPEGFDALMNWGKSGSGAPTVYFSAPQLVGGGNRTFNASWGGPAWPLTVKGLTFVDYMYGDQGARLMSHELGHFVGHGPELYASAPGDKCNAGAPAGYLGPYDVMGNQWEHYAAMSAANRWRFGFAQARHLVPADKTTEVTLKPAMTHGENRSLAVIQPDPVGHPDEVFVVENRAEVVVSGKSYDAVDPSGMFIYHVNSKGFSNDAPLIDLVSDPTRCPSKLVPFQGSYTPTSVPAAKFHDGTSAKFSITNVEMVGSTLKFKVSFGSGATRAGRRRRR
ncbi:MAG: hypothetical protein K0V04_21560 [Deltaproteobacteria bacterium]|nr:hypothetical protein [Deltaproteobacteria bacterium]